MLKRRSSICPECNETVASPAGVARRDPEGGSDVRRVLGHLPGGLGLGGEAGMAKDVARLLLALLRPIQCRDSRGDG